jgi:allophanate hydrolase
MTFLIKDIVERHRAGRSVVETIRDTYARIRAWNDPALFITLKEEAAAIAEAEALEHAGQRDLPLFGVPFAVKDNIDVAGLPTTAACPAFAYTPEKSAFVIERLVGAGAIVIGKTNLDQFATGLVGVRSPYGVPRNAIRADLVPGGSSAGSASAVAAGIVPFALGTDTAGSGRVPAALQGLVGLKPSIGAFSMTGVVPACRSLDCVSVFANTVVDAESVFSVAAAFDTADGYSRRFAPMAPGGFAPSLRIGVPRPEDLIFLGDALASAAFDAAIKTILAKGGTPVPVSMAPLYETATLLYEGPWVAERYVATRAIFDDQPESMHAVTRAIIGNARKFDAASVYQATYRLMDLRRKAEQLWSEVDVLVVPSIPTIYTVEQVLADPIVTNSNFGTYTNFVNLLDMAALAIPMEKRGDGLPAGVTLIAPAGKDAFLARLGKAILGEKQIDAPLPEGMMEIAVVGAHLSEMPLNGQLTSRGATLRRAAKTASDYQLVKLAGGPPLRPGLIRIGAGQGSAIALEVWAMPEEAFGSFLAGIPRPLGLGKVLLEDGGVVTGFVCESDGLEGAEDITRFGGWRAYVAGLST